MSPCGSVTTRRLRFVTVVALSTPVVYPCWRPGLCEWRRTLVAVSSNCQYCLSSLKTTMNLDTNVRESGLLDFSTLKTPGSSFEHRSLGKRERLVHHSSNTNSTHRIAKIFGSTHGADSQSNSHCFHPLEDLCRRHVDCFIAAAPRAQLMPTILPYALCD